MDRSQKADLVAELKSVFSETSVVVITRNLGLTVAQSTDLRLKMRDAGAQFKVAKNRLALIALEGTKYGPIGDMLTGPTALATSIDPVAAAKVAVEFAKTNDRLEIVGGARATLCSTSTASRRSPRCRRSTSFVASWWASSRRRRARLLARCRSRARNWPASSGLTPRKQPDFSTSFNARHQGPQSPQGVLKWQTSPSSSTICRR